MSNMGKFDDLPEKFDDLPEKHPREAVVRAAEHELSSLVAELVRKHGLTAAETLRVVNSSLCQEVGFIARRLMVRERQKAK